MLFAYMQSDITQPYVSTKSLLARLLNIMLNPALLLHTDVECYISSIFSQQNISIKSIGILYLKNNHLSGRVNNDQSRILT